MKRATVQPTVQPTTGVQAIRETLGSGPVVVQPPKKKGQSVGPKEKAMRELREARSART